MLIKSVNLIVCLTVFCLQLSVVFSDIPNEEIEKQYKLVTEFVSQSVDPCDDFYKYTCSQSKTSMAKALQSNYDLELKQLLEFNPDSGEIMKPTFIEKLLAVYFSDKTVNDTAYFDILKPEENLEWPLINKLYGGEKQNFEYFNVFEFVGNLFSYGFNNHFLDLNIKRLSNGTLYIALNKPNADDETDKFSAFTEQLLKHLGFSNEAENFLAYKKEIQNLHKYWQTSYKKYPYSSQTIFTYAQFDINYPELRTILVNALPNQLQDDDIIELNNLEYMEFLSNKQWRANEIEELCNYLMAGFYSYMTPLVNNLKMEGNEVNKFLHMAYNFLYYKFYLQPNEQDINKSFDTLAEQIYMQILALIEENNLQFTNEQIQAIKEKFGKLHITKGNLPDHADYNPINEIYKDLPELIENSYTINILRLLKYHFLEKINCPKHVECRAEIGPLPVNFVENNLMIVPFASFRRPMYHWNFDPLLSISLIGTLLGHELTRSIDISSLLSENIYPIHYKEFERNSRLNNAKKCLLDQNSSNDITESVADFAGTRAAYQLYAKKYNVHPAYSTLSWQKLFFLNLAQYFCQGPDEETTQQAAYNLRLNQIVMNTNEFTEAFQCPVGSKMNPKEKCRFY